MREVLSGLIKGISADKIHEETVEIEHIDLYYRPVYAFQYRWKSKAKDAILECEALTGKLQIGESTFQQYMGKMLDPGFLFDVGMEALYLIVPGGGLVAKLAQKGIQVTKKNNLLSIPMKRTPLLERRGSFGHGAVPKQGALIQGYKHFIHHL